MKRHLFTCYLEVTQCLFRIPAQPQILKYSHCSIPSETLVQNRKPPTKTVKYDDYQWLVTHSHSHSDHIAGDDQFRNKPNVTLIEPNLEAVQKAFNLNKEQWPNKHAHLDLGNRKLTIIPLPGHKSDAVAVYDSETQWLLTGDSLYPGRLVHQRMENI